MEDKKKPYHNEAHEYFSNMTDEEFKTTLEGVGLTVRDVEKGKGGLTFTDSKTSQ